MCVIRVGSSPMGIKLQINKAFTDKFVLRRRRACYLPDSYDVHPPLVSSFKPLYIKTEPHIADPGSADKEIWNGASVSVTVPHRHKAFYLWPRGTWIDMVSSSASSLVTAASNVKTSPAPKLISTSGTMADWLLSPRTLATLPCEWTVYIER